MSGVTTIIIARDDLSVPGVTRKPTGGGLQAAEDRNLFDVLDERVPDVLVLDCRGPTRNGLPAIEKIRERTSVPLLVICEADDPLQGKYLMNGATDCLQSPFDILIFNSMLQDIVQRSRQGHDDALNRLLPMSFSGINFDPRDNSLQYGANVLKLTTSESRLIVHFARKPGLICSRQELSEVLYGDRRPVSDRAIDAIIVRLRKKLGDVSNGTADGLIKTEFRLGYMFTSRVDDVMPV